MFTPDLTFRLFEKKINRAYINDNLNLLESYKIEIEKINGVLNKQKLNELIESSKEKIFYK